MEKYIITEEVTVQVTVGKKLSILFKDGVEGALPKRRFVTRKDENGDTIEKDLPPTRRARLSPGDKIFGDDPIIESLIRGGQAVAESKSKLGRPSKKEKEAEAVGLEKG